MLRNMKVAAVLRTETIEEENETRETVRKFTFAYIPIYAILSLLVYILEILIFSNANKHERTLIIIYIIINLLKFCCETFIGITTFKFATSIKKLITLVKYEFGETFPQIQRLKLMRLLLISMSATYILVDCFYNLILPAGLVTIVLTR